MAAQKKKATKKATPKRVAHRLGSRKRKEIGGRLSERDRKFCGFIAQGKPVAEAARLIGVSEGYGYQLLDKPKVSAYVQKLNQRVEEKAIEKVAEKIALTLDLGDTRLAELLNAPRANMAAMLKLKMAQRMKADNPNKQILMDEAIRELGPTASIDDFVLMKSVELLYKRLGGLVTKPQPPVQPSPMANAIVNQVQVNVSNNPLVPSTGAGVYEPKWARERYGIVDPESERIEQQHKVAEYLSSGPITCSTADASEAMDSADDAADGSS